jgi:hypothetical protein
MKLIKTSRITQIYSVEQIMTTKGERRETKLPWNKSLLHREQKRVGHATNKVKEHIIMEQNLKLKEQITTRRATNIIKGTKFVSGTKISTWNKTKI